MGISQTDKLVTSIIFSTQQLFKHLEISVYVCVCVCVCVCVFRLSLLFCKLNILNLSYQTSLYTL